MNLRSDLVFIAVKVGIPEFLNGVGNGVETHVAKLESGIGDFQKLLITRTLKLKKLGIPCKHVIIPNSHCKHKLCLICMPILSNCRNTYASYFYAVIV